MSKRTKVRISIYFIGLVMPILGMCNCEAPILVGSKIGKCFFENDLLRSYADFYYNLWISSLFLMFIPLAIYIGLVILIARYLPRII